MKGTKDRRAALEAYANDPDGSIDINHLERAFKAIPMKKAWLFLELNLA